MKKKILMLPLMLVMAVMFTIGASAECDNCIEAAAEEPAEHCSANCTNDSYENCGCGDTYVFQYCNATHEYVCIGGNGLTHDFECSCGDMIEEYCEMDVTVEASCSGSGVNACSVCGYFEEIPALDHTWVLVDKKIATCQSAGQDRYECSGCGETQVENFPKTEHKIVNGKCTICMAEINATTTGPGSSSGGSRPIVSGGGSTKKKDDDVLGNRVLAVLGASVVVLGAVAYVSQRKKI